MFNDFIVLLEGSIACKTKEKAKTQVECQIPCHSSFVFTF